MTADDYADMTKSERRRYDYERNFDFDFDLPDFKTDEIAPEPTPEEDEAFQAARRESGGGRYNPRED